MDKNMVSDGHEPLRVFGARTHNLKNVDVEIPKNQITVITGPSGSGKSSLAFDTIFVEGQRQYMESLSTYSRQFLRRLTRPTVGRITGLQPTIAIDQRPADNNPLSIVATVTEILDFLRVLFARVGVAHCYKCGRPIYRQSLGQISRQICTLPEGSRFMLLAPIVIEERGAHQEVFKRLLKSGFARVRVDGTLKELDSSITLDPQEKHTIEVVVDRLIRRSGFEDRLLKSLQLTAKQGDGLVCCLHEKDRQKTDQGTTRSVWREVLFSTKYSCPKCGVSYSELEPRSFSFNSQYGACSSCRGTGKMDAFDPRLLVSDSSLTLENGALSFEKGLAVSTRRKLNSLLARFQMIVPEQYSQPLSTWDEETKMLFFFGQKSASNDRKNSNRCFGFNSEQIDTHGYASERDDSYIESGSERTEDDETEERESTESSDNLEGFSSGNFKNEVSSKLLVCDQEELFPGLVNFLKLTYDENRRKQEHGYLESFRGRFVCYDCKGERVSKEARSVTVCGKTLSEILRLTVAEAIDWFSQLKFDELKKDVAESLIDQIIKRLETLRLLRLDYLTLDRSTDTLSGGELQRARLTTAMGNSLAGVCYILDEPTDGLHPRDVDRLLEVVESIRNNGNTVILVEHNERVMRNAEWLIDVGPEAGAFGGRIVAAGVPEQIARRDNSPTGLFLSGKKIIRIPEKRRKVTKMRSIVLEGVETNNLKNVTVAFPLGVFF